MIQLVQPNLSVVGKVTWCLLYARQVFSADKVEATAWDAWTNADYKHTDALPDVAVPVWFSYWGTINGIYQNWGHVAVYVPGQGFYSSPYKTTQTHAVLSSISEVERIYGCKYVGWSEDISNVRVAKDIGMIVDKNNLKYLYLGIYGETVADEKLASDNWIGKDYAEATQAMLDYANKNGYAYWQVKPQLEATINDLKVRQEELGKVVTNKDNEITRLNKEIESLKAQVGDNTKWETFKALIRELIK
jgi:hypothetical protein